MKPSKNPYLGQRKSAVRSNLTIRSSSQGKTKVPLARESKIPGGHYRSKITSIKATKTSAGAEAAEVIYELTADDGSVRKMREIIPLDSWPFKLFCNALVAAGLKEGAELTEAVGVTENVVLSYSEDNELGHFSSRTPISAQAPHKAQADQEADDQVSEDDSFDDDQAEDDDEFDDFLEEID